MAEENDGTCLDQFAEAGTYPRGVVEFKIGEKKIVIEDQDAEDKIIIGLLSQSGIMAEIVRLDNMRPVSDRYRAEPVLQLSY